MKKITLALSALLTASAAFAGYLDYGTNYVLVPSNTAAQANGKYLTANTDGSVSYTNTYSAASTWEYNGRQDEQTYQAYEFLKNGDKYLSFDEGEHATLSSEEALAFSGRSTFVDGAVCFFNKANFGFASAGAAYLNALNLTGEPVNSASCAFWAISVTAETTEAELDAAIKAKNYTNAKVIICAGPNQRNGGYFLTVNDEGTLIHNNTLDDNALWNVTTTNKTTTLQNIGKGGYAYTSDFKLSEQPIDLRMADNDGVYGAYAFTTDTDPNASTINWLNARGNSTEIADRTGNDAGSGFFILPYDLNKTIEEYKAEADQLYADGVAKLPIITSLTNMMNASSYGKSYGNSYINALKQASGEEEITNAKNEGIQAAIDFAEQQMSEGFALYNNVTENFFNFVPDNADAPFQRAADADAYGLWVAEWVDEPTAQDDAAASFVAKSFKLRNVKANTYLMQPEGYTQKVMNSDAEHAAVFHIVPSEYDPEGNQTVGGLTLNFEDVNTSLYLSINWGDTNLSSWYYANDRSSYWSFLDMPAIDQAEAYIDFGGEYTEDEMIYGKVYTSINSVDIIMPKGAVATGIGEVVFGSTDNPYALDEIEVLKTWTGAEIAAITPVEKEISTEEYDFDTDDFITVTTTVSVISLPIEPALNEPATYVANATKNIFAVTNEEGTFYNDLMSVNTEITAPLEPGDVPVTPAAGIVEEITEISLGAATEDEQGWYVNYSDENVTVKFNGEIAKNAEGADLDIDAETMDFDYYISDETHDGYYLTVNFTEAGKYELYIPEGFFINFAGTQYNEEKTVVWTIDEKDGILEIGSVTVNGEEIYDLAGRKVAKAGKGLYIINGKKVVK